MDYQTHVESAGKYVDKMFDAFKNAKTDFDKGRCMIYMSQLTLVSTMFKLRNPSIDFALSSRTEKDVEFMREVASSLVADET